MPGLVARRKRERAWFLTGRLPGERLSDRAAANEVAHFIDAPDIARARIVNLVQLNGADLMKGYRTILVGGALAIGPAALQYLGAVDWPQIVGPTGAFSCPASSPSSCASSRRRLWESRRGGAGE